MSSKQATSPQTQPQTHVANPPGNPLAAEAERKQKAMASESESHVADTPHINQGSAHIKQPDKSRNGA